jgi:hypothetical protein
MAALEDPGVGMPILNVFLADPKSTIHIHKRGFFGELRSECVRVLQVPGSHQTGGRVFGAGLDTGGGY